VFVTSTNPPYVMIAAFDNFLEHSLADSLRHDSITCIRAVFQQLNAVLRTARLEVPKSRARVHLGTCPKTFWVERGTGTFCSEDSAK